jgi:MFS family permease
MRQGATNAPGVAGMIGCGVAGSFGQLLAARCLTGVGSALQNTGAQLFLADISTPENRAQCLGTNQVIGRPTGAASACAGSQLCSCLLQLCSPRRPSCGSLPTM